MKKIFRAVFTLSFFNLLDRVFGFVFKIYLSKTMGVRAMGIYQVAFSLFMLLLTLVTSGMPLIVSKMTARCRAENKLCSEGSISTAALIISIIFSTATCLFILVFNRFIGRLFADDHSRIVLLLMLPALIFSAVYSSLRGNLWGRQKYMTVSLLELSEQIARIAICILLFSLGFDKLKSVGISTSIACLIGAIVCTVCYFASGARLKNPKGNFKPLIKASLPITAARASTAAMTSITAIAAPFLLMLSGKNNTDAMYEFGYSMGMALPLLYIPLTVVGSLAFALIPTLSRAVAEKNESSVKRQIDGAIKTSVIVAMLFFPLFFALGRPMGMFIYSNADSGNYLRFTAWLLIPISIESITSSMMHSLDMEIRGLVHYFIGAALMFGIFFASGKHFSVQLMSIGMGASWILSSVLNMIAMRKKCKVGFGFVGSLIGAGALCVPTVYLSGWLYNILEPLHEFWRIGFSGGIGIIFITVLSFVFGILKLDFFVSGKSKRTNAGTKKRINNLLRKNKC